MNNLTLDHNEEILWQGRPHAKVYIFRIGLIMSLSVLFVVTLISILSYLFFNDEAIQNVFIFISIFEVLLIAAFAYFAVDTIKKELAKEYIVTNKRIINVGANHFFYSGLPHPIIINLSQITNLKVRYHVADAIFKQHTGTVEIETPYTTVHSSKGLTRVPFVLRNINNPEDVLQLIEQHILIH